MGGRASLFFVCAMIFPLFFGLGSTFPHTHVYITTNCCRDVLDIRSTHPNVGRRDKLYASLQPRAGGGGLEYLTPAPLSIHKSFIAWGLRSWEDRKFRSIQLSRERQHLETNSGHKKSTTALHV